MRALLVTVLLLGIPVAAGALPFAPPVADFTWEPTFLGAGDDVTFTALAHDDAAILVHRWHVPGDDDLTLRLEPRTQHAFARAGTYNVTLDVIDATGQHANVTRAVHVANLPPVLSMEIVEAFAFRGREVLFHGSASDRDGDVVSGWTWDLGDGATALGQNVTHAYSQLGRFTVTLSASDATGNVAFASGVVRVFDHPPVVNATYSPTTPVAGEPVVFTANGMDPDGSGPLTYTWRFSDGVELSGQEVTRAFSAPGGYTAALRATDGAGSNSAPFLLTIEVASS